MELVSIRECTRIYRKWKSNQTCDGECEADNLFADLYTNEIRVEEEKFWGGF